jgi:hypothetical protein
MSSLGWFCFSFEILLVVLALALAVLVSPYCVFASFVPLYWAWYIWRTEHDE